MLKVGEVTARGEISTCEEAVRPVSLALVIVWSALEPHRVGEIAFFPFGQRLFVGRGDVEIEKFAHFFPHRPGELVAIDPCRRSLAGDHISRRHLRIWYDSDGLHMKAVGKYPTHVNGVPSEQAILRPGDTVLLANELLLLCVERPMELARPHPARDLHAFGQPDENGIVGESPAIWQLRRQLALVAQGDDHVFVQGESGTGKVLASRAIHALSARARGPFVSHNAESFTESLLESQLFGNAANYPNPGTPARPGVIGSAHCGTLFLDEVGDCSWKAQTLLLTVLDSGEYCPVGEATERRADVRLVGATNRDENSFRHDFLYRFSGRVRVPPLRERREDIPLLIRYLLLQHARKFPEVGERFLRQGPDGRLEPKISARLVDYLVRHRLAGNTRELRIILRRAIDEATGDKLRMPSAAAMSSEKQGSVLPASEPPQRSGEPVAPRRDPPSREELLEFLERAGGNVAEAARLLGMTRSALGRLMQSYQMRGA